MQLVCVQCNRAFRSDRLRKYCSLECHYDHWVIKKDGCWDWRGEKWEGYRRLKVIEAWSILGHRHAYERFVGPIPEGLFVLHTCDNTRCSNPKHLFVGTKKDNAQDCIKKDRFRYSPYSFANNKHVIPRGEKHHSAKLKEADVIAIRASAEGPIALAKRYGIARRSVWRIRKNMVWKTVA